MAVNYFGNQFFGGFPSFVRGPSYSQIINSQRSEQYDFGTGFPAASLNVVPWSGNYSRGQYEQRYNELLGEINRYYTPPVDPSIEANKAAQAAAEEASKAAAQAAETKAQQVAAPTLLNNATKSVNYGATTLEQALQSRNRQDPSKIKQDQYAGSSGTGMSTSMISTGNILVKSLIGK